MRSTIRLDDQLLEKAKQYALTHGTTFTAIFLMPIMQHWQ